MKKLRTERVTVGPASGPLDVRGNTFEAALLIEGRLAAFQWCDCCGSVGQHLVRRTSPNAMESIQRFRRSVDAPIESNQSLAAHFAEILSLLTAGDYQLDLEELPADSYVVDLADNISGVEVTNFYPGFGAMVATQPTSQMSDHRLGELVRTIQSGTRPTVVTLSAKGVWSEFIIDGHHKLAAYRQADVPIRRLAITRLSSPALPLSTPMEFLPKEGELRRHLAKHRPDTGEDSQ